MGFSYNVNVLNQKGSPAIYTDTFANRPAPGYAGRLFVSSDTSAIYEDTGTAWTLIANVSSGAGTLQQVTTNGNTSNVGISITAGGLSTNSLTDTALTSGSVTFAGSGGLISQDNANLFWDDTNNRLGINTNTPGNSLDVHTSGTTPILALNNTAGNQSAISFLNTSVAKWRIGNIATTNTFDIYNFGLASNAIKINNGDNSVEITNNINVQSNGSIFGSNANGSDPVRIQANNAQKVIRFYNLAAGTADLSIGGNLTSSAFYFSTYSTANALRIEDSGSLLVNNPTDDGVNKLQVNGSATINGNLGIGTTTPSSFAGYTNVSIKAGANGSNLDLFSSANVRLANFVLNGTTSAYIGTVTTLPFDITQNDFTRIRVANGGSILIGSIVDDTVNKLQVTGTAKITASATTAALIVENSGIYGSWVELKATSTGGKRYIVQSTGASAAEGTGKLVINNATDALTCVIISSTGVVTISNLAGTGSRAVLADASGNLSAPVSDISVKENIEPLKYGLNTIMQLNAVQFEFIEGYKNYGEGLQIGAIAQEVEQIIPEAVFKTPSTGLKGIDYNQFNGIYIKAIQDQQKIIESLIQRIELLENK
jgi:hypothetical protein